MPTPNNTGNAPDQQGLTFGPAVQQDTHVGGQPAGGGQPSGGGQPDHSDLTFGPAVQQATPVGQQDQPGFFSRAYETSGLKGIVDLGKATAQRPIDLYHQAVEAAQKGDWKSASEAANHLLAMPITAGLDDKDSPLRKAATAIIMQPVNAVADEFKNQRKQGQGKVQAAVSTADNLLNPATRVVNAVHAAAPRVKSDIASGNYAGVAGDAIGAATENNAVGAVPLLGGAVQQVGGNLDTDLHNHNYGAVLGDVTGPLATMGVGKLLGALGLGGEEAGAAAADTTGVKPPPIPGEVTPNPNIPKVAPGTTNVAGQEIPVSTNNPTLAAGQGAASKVLSSVASPEGAAKFVKNEVAPAAAKAVPKAFTQTALDSAANLRNLRGDAPLTPGTAPKLYSIDDIANYMKKEAKGTYSKLDDAAKPEIQDWEDKYGDAKPSGPKTIEGEGPEIPDRPKSFTQLQDQVRNAKATANSKFASQVDKEAAQEALPKYQQEMDDFLDKHSDVVNDGELEAANKVHAQGLRYEYIADRLRSAFKGTTGGTTTAGQPTTISVGPLQRLESQFDIKYQPGAFKKLLGPQGYRNYNEVLNTMASPKVGSAFMDWLNQIPLNIGKVGAIPVSKIADHLLFNPEAGSTAIKLFKATQKAAGAAKDAVKATARVAAPAAQAAPAVGPSLQQQQQSVMSDAASNLGGQ
jgi:hypothetical protein